MNCRFHRIQIEELKRREILPEETRAHLDICGACARAYHEQTALQNLIGELKPVAAPADFDARLYAVLAARQETRSRRPTTSAKRALTSIGELANWLPRARLGASRLIPLAVAACCVIAFVTVAWLRQKAVEKRSAHVESAKQMAQLFAPASSPTDAGGGSARAAHEARLSSNSNRSSVAVSRTSRRDPQRSELRKVLIHSNGAAQIASKASADQNAMSATAKTDSSAITLAPNQKNDFSSTAAPRLISANPVSTDLPNSKERAPVIGALDANRAPTISNAIDCLVNADVAQRPQNLSLAARLGIEGRAINDASASQSSKRGSFLIEKVAPTSLAARARLQAGDVIETLNALPAAAILAAPAPPFDVSATEHDSRKTLCILTLRIIREGKGADLKLHLLEISPPSNRKF